MIINETDQRPACFEFDLALVAVGYERRCRWVTEHCHIRATFLVALEFGFLAERSYEDNKLFFRQRNCQFIDGLSENTPDRIAEAIVAGAPPGKVVEVFVDISSMSREMIANVILGIYTAARGMLIHVSCAYAPSEFSGPSSTAPIRSVRPVRAALAGWSCQPEQPLGAVFGLGCEPNLALGALQLLEPDKAWVYRPRGIDAYYDTAMTEANAHIEDIFDVTSSDYDITTPTVTRGRVEALFNAVDGYFRLIGVPLGPKIFSWLMLGTVVFTGRTSIGVWTFSSRERAVPVDRSAEGTIIWHRFLLRLD